MHLAWAAASHPGRRASNEDSYCARPDLGLFVVADGMGGHAAGEVASRVAVEVIEAFVAETAGASATDTWPLPYEPQHSVTVNRLKTAFRLANRRIGVQAAETEGLKGMATTASAVLLAGAIAAVAHVGDSRVYLLRQGGLQRLTRDHSWVEEQVRAGALSADAARNHPWRSVVTRALSGAPEVDVDVTEVPLEPGDRLLLCSDGLFAVTADERIGRLLGEPEPLPAVCDRLVRAANDEGGPDNVTTLVLQLDAA